MRVLDRPQKRSGTEGRGTRGRGNARRRICRISAREDRDRASDEVIPPAETAATRRQLRRLEMRLLRRGLLPGLRLLMLLLLMLMLLLKIICGHHTGGKNNEQR